MYNWTWLESSTKVQLDVGRIPRGPLTPGLDWTCLESPEVCIHQGPISHGSDPPRSAYTKAQLDLGRIPRGHSASCLGRGGHLGSAQPSRFRGSGVMAESSHLRSPECLAQSDLVCIAYLSYVPSASWLGRGCHLCRSPTISIQRWRHDGRRNLG